MLRFSYFLLLFVSLSLAGCKNKDVTHDVQRYCSCLTEHKTNPEGRESCLEMMDEIKAKYAGDNRALLQILEETDGCM
jgi:hypothetical protein